MSDNKKHIAIVLAGGRGRRMKSDIPKQYMEIGGKPVLYYSLSTFEKSFVDDIVLVTGKDDIEYCKKEIVEKYHITKVSNIVGGGKERYDSVYQGLQVVYNRYKCNLEDVYIYIHDGARPCVTNEVLESCKVDVMIYNACVAAVPVKDTIKVVNASGFVSATPDRTMLWQIQTPQTFRMDIVYDAYTKMLQSKDLSLITDDAMVVEKFGNVPVKMTKSTYNNIKITTLEDILIIEQLLKY